MAAAALESERGGAAPRGSCGRMAERAKDWLLTPKGKDVTRSWLAMTVPTVLLYATKDTNWLGSNGFTFVLYPVILALLVRPPCVGVYISLGLRIILSVCVGQAYAFLVVWLFADNWVGIVVCLALLSFVSAFVLQKDLGWGIALCLAGTVMNFLLIKQQYALFYQQGISGWDARGEVLRACMDISKDLIFASSMGIIVACFICIIVWPQFMGAELNKMLRFVVLPNMKRTLEEVSTHFSQKQSLDSAEKLFKDQQQLFMNIEMLPLMLSVANLEWAWSVTDVAKYFEQLIETFMGLSAMTSHIARVVLRAKCPEFIPDDLGFIVANRAEKTLHSISTDEDEEKAAEMQEKLVAGLEKPVEAYVKMAVRLLELTQANLQHRVPSIMSKAPLCILSPCCNAPAEPLACPDLTPFDDETKAQDEAMEEAMKSTLRNVEDVRIWLKSRKSFYTSQFISGIRISSRLAKMSVKQSGVNNEDWQACPRFANLCRLMQAIWTPTPTHRNVDMPINLRSRPTDADTAVCGCARPFLNLITDRPFKIALRVSLAVALTVSFGFIPTTANYFDSISGLVSVIYVLFDAGTMYQGDLFTKAAFRVCGMTFAALLAMAAWYTGHATPNPTAIIGTVHILFGTAIVLFVKLAEWRIMTLKDRMFLGLFTYMPFVALIDTCTRQKCDFMENTGIRFLSLFLSLVISFIFNLTMFPIRAEYDIRKGTGQTFADLALTYGYLTSELSTHVMYDMDEARHLGEMCRRLSMGCFLRSQRLRELLDTSMREPGTGTWHYNKEHFRRLLADCDYSCRVLAFLSRSIETYAQDPNCRLFLREDNIDLVRGYQSAQAAELYRRLRSQVFTKLGFVAYTLQTKDILLPQGLRHEMSQSELASLADGLASLNAERITSQVFCHPDFAFVIVLQRAAHLLNFLCDDMELQCCKMFGQAIYTGDLSLVGTRSIDRASFFKSKQY